VVVADEEGVLGFGCTGSAPDDPATGQLFAFYLHPDAWGRGHGARLHAGALDRLRRAGFVHARLWVLDGNERALRFYRRQGWVETGRTAVEPGPEGVELRERELTRPLD
jgi:GNAT superfamily N-acetyltransferase